MCLFPQRSGATEIVTGMIGHVTRFTFMPEHDFRRQVKLRTEQAIQAAAAPGARLDASHLERLVDAEMTRLCQVRTEAWGEGCARSNDT